MDVTRTSKRRLRIIHSIALFCNVAILLTGALALLGWQFDLPGLRSVVPAFPALNPVSAVCFILIGSAFLLFRLRKKNSIQIIFAVLSSLILLAGLWRLMELVVHPGTDISVFFFTDQALAEASQMHAGTAIGMTLTGIGLLLMGFARKPYWSQTVGILIFFLVTIPFLNYCYGELNFRGWEHLAQMAFHSVLSFVFVAPSFLLMHSGRGIARLFSGNGLGSHQFRLLFPVTVLSVAVLGFLLIRGERAGFYSAYFGIILFAGMLIILMTVLLAWNSLLIDKREDQINHLGNIVKSVNDAIFSTDEHFTIHSWNKACEEMFGYRAHEVIGTNVRAVLRTQQPEERTEEIRAILHDEGVWSGEIIYLRKDNSPITVLISLTMLKLTNGEFGGYVGISKDITERKAAEDRLLENEQKLRISEEKHRLFFENSLSYLCTHDMNGMLLSVNEAAAGSLGYKPHEMVGRRLSDFLEDRHVADFDTYLHAVSTSGEAEGVMSLKSSGNTEKYWLFRNSLVTHEGQHYIIGTAIDLTDRLSLEKDLRTAIGVARQAVEAKDNFLANMSHEIRTPLNAVIGFTDVLMGTELNADQRDYLQLVQVAGRNLLSIINDILDLSKIESGKLEIDSFAFNPQTVVRHVHQLLSGQAGEKQLDLKLTGTETLPEMVIGDGNRLSQILINLVGNAIKFTAEGQVEIAVRVMETTDEAHLIHVTIRDTGIGISQEKLDLIFERFTQVNNDTTRQFGGTGLGLSIAKWLVELQGGLLRVTSEEGKGSEFSFTIPFRKASASEATVMAVADRTAEPVAARILLCEDNILNQRLARVVITGFGYDLTVANNGREGVELLEQEDFDLVLMDLQMPEMDGYMATEYIRYTLKRDIPIIAMTAHSLAGEREKCIERGMTDYISKPFNQDELFQKIHDGLRFSRKQRQSGALEIPVVSVQEPQLESIVSLAYLRELSGGNKDFEVGIIRLYLDQTPRDFSELEAAYAGANYPEVKSVAHKLKSSVSVIQSTTLLRLLEVLEQAGITEIFNEQTHAKMEALKAAVAQSCDELQALLEKEYYQG